MSDANTKELTIDVKDLSIEKEQYIEDLQRFLEEQLPQIEISRSGNSIELIVPSSLANIFRTLIISFCFCSNKSTFFFNSFLS